MFLPTDFQVVVSFLLISTLADVLKGNFSESKGVKTIKVPSS